MKLSLFAKRALCSLVSLQIALTPTLAFPQSQKPAQADDKFTPELQKDILLNHFAMVDHELPGLTRLGSDPELADTAMWKIENSPLLDANPFFLNSQTWEPAPTRDGQIEKLRSVFRKDGSELVLGMGGLTKALRISEAFTPFLETVEYVFLSADSDKIFREKSPESAAPGEGIFFVVKKDIVAAAKTGEPVPLFYFPLPGQGWTNLKHGFEFVISDQIVVYNQAKEGLPLDRQDIAKMEDIQRANLVIAHTWSVLEGQAQPSGRIKARPNTTLLFGVYLSGQLPQKIRKFGMREAGAAFLKAANSVGRLALPQAQADEERPVMGGQWKRWITPAALWTGLGLFTAHAYDDVDWSKLITDDMGANVMKVTAIVGAIFATSVIMKYKLHKDLFAKKYPKAENETILQTVNREHKGIFDEFANAQWTAFSTPGQTIRTLVNFLKDRVLPDNKAVEKAWDATMGWQMRQNSKLPMNHKTFWYGAIIHGMSDSLQVMAFLLIIIPYVYSSLGIEITTGSAAAAFVSAEIIRNFLGYLQTGAHDYSAEVKMIQQSAVEREVKRKMVAEGLDPELSKNKSIFDERVEAEMEIRFKALGLPGKDDFMYDPVSIIESLMAKVGYSSEKFLKMSGEDFEHFRDRYGIDEKKSEADAQEGLRGKFVLSKKRWGLVNPALKRALQTARDMQTRAPSPLGAKVVQTLEWALENKNLTPGIAGRAWDVAASKWGAQEFKKSVSDSLNEDFKDLGDPEQSRLRYPVRYLKSVVKGSLRALVADGTRKARDIRSVLFLMSSYDDPAQFIQFFPESWKEKAGSDQAALLAADIFHKSFFSILEHKEDKLNPTDETRAQYGEAASRLATQRGAKSPALNDPFARLAVEQEFMFELKSRQKARQDRLGFEPKKYSWYGRIQMDRARRAGDQILAAYVADPDISPEWKGLAERYQTVNGQEIDEAAWVESHKKRMIYARQIAKQVGLTVEDPQQSEFVRKVILGASSHAEGQLAKPEEKAYMLRLSEADRLFYESQVFTHHFISSYVEHSVAVHDHINGSSPEYPGRFQAVRRAIVGNPGEKIMMGITKTFEALWRNEDTTYRPGVLSLLDRNVPFVPDAVHNLVRMGRVIPYLLMFGYPVSYYLWQIKMPFSLYAASLVFGTVGIALVEFNNRLMKNHGIRPMEDIPSKMTYSWVHGILTNSTFGPVMQYAQPMANGFEGYVVKPVKDLANAGCEAVLGSGRR